MSVRMPDFTLSQLHLRSFFPGAPLDGLVRCEREDKTEYQDYIDTSGTRHARRRVGPERIEVTVATVFGSPLCEYLYAIASAGDPVDGPPGSRMMYVDGLPELPRDPLSQEFRFSRCGTRAALRDRP